MNHGSYKNNSMSSTSTMPPLCFVEENHIEPLEETWKNQEETISRPQTYKLIYWWFKCKSLTWKKDTTKFQMEYLLYSFSCWNYIVFRHWKIGYAKGTTWLHIDLFELTNNQLSDWIAQIRNWSIRDKPWICMCKGMLGEWMLAP